MGGSDYIFSREVRHDLPSHKITEHMPIRPIIRYPDPRLAVPAQPVTVFDGALRDLASDLLETMHAAPGIGITAPHIGISLRVVILDLDAIDGARTYVNPEIIWASPETILHQEGSVSMPGIKDEIRRHARIRISYHDINGNLQTEESDGLRAVCHQHEIDQLNGLFWIAPVPPQTRTADQKIREKSQGGLAKRNPPILPCRDDIVVRA
jgi:peptide deformylase